MHKHNNIFYQENSPLLPLDARGSYLQYHKVCGLKVKNKFLYRVQYSDKSLCFMPNFGT